MECFLMGSLEDMTSGLASAINSLPEMQRRKMLVDTHTNMATSMMKAINERELDALFAMEERMTVSRYPKPSLLNPKH